MADRQAAFAGRLQGSKRGRGILDLVQAQHCNFKAALLGSSPPLFKGKGRGWGLYVEYLPTQIRTHSLELYILSNLDHLDLFLLCGPQNRNLRFFRLR